MDLINNTELLARIDTLAKSYGDEAPMVVELLSDVRKRINELSVHEHAYASVAEFREWELARMEVKWRYAEYNYAGVMLRLAKEKVAAHEAEE